MKPPTAHGLQSKNGLVFCYLGKVSPVLNAVTQHVSELNIPELFYKCPAPRPPYLQEPHLCFNQATPVALVATFSNAMLISARKSKLFLPPTLPNEMTSSHGAHTNFVSKDFSQTKQGFQRGSECWGFTLCCQYLGTHTTTYTFFVMVLFTPQKRNAKNLNQEWQRWELCSLSPGFHTFRSLVNGRSHTTTSTLAFRAVCWGKEHEGAKVSFRVLTRVLKGIK